MSLYRLKITSKKNTSVYRIIDIIGVQHFEVLHRAIIKSMKFQEGELASFYINYEDETKRLEICLSEIQGEDGATILMKETKIQDIFSNDIRKITYVYDFLNFWLFDVELLEKLDERKTNITYPHVSESVGTAPVQTNSDDDYDLAGEDARLVAELIQKNTGLFDDELLDDFTDTDDEDLDDYPDNDDYI